MSKGDALIFSKFFNKMGDKFFNYRFDVRVGAGVKLPDNSPEWLKKSARDLTTKRIDTVMENTKNIFIVEARVNAKSNVIGELITYRILYSAKFNPSKKVIPFLITDSVGPDVLIVLNDLKFPFLIV